NPSGERGQILRALFGDKTPDIIYDGIINPAKLVNGTLPAPLRIYITDNGAATFANLNWSALPDLTTMKTDQQKVVALLAHHPKIERDLKAYEGELPSLPAVILPGLQG